MRVSPSVLVALSVLPLASPALAQPDFLRSTEPVARYDGHRIVRVFPRGVASVREYQTAIALTDDVWTHTPRLGQPLDIRQDTAQYAALVASGLPHTVLVENLQATLDAEIAATNAPAVGDDAAWYTSYKNYASVRAYCDSLAATYPNLCQVVVIGQSFQGRDIFALRITGPGSASARPGAFYHGCQHAREWVTVPTVVYAAEKLLTDYATDPSVAALVNGVEFYFAPIVNPDGYEYTWTTNRLWRKNRQPNSGSTCVGTDNNRNWGYQWGGEGASTNPCDLTYRGSAAFSGKETQVLRDFVNSKPNLRAYIDFHSYSQLLMWPWAYTATPAPDQAVFNTVGTQMQAAIVGAFNTPYTAGPIYTTIYPASGGGVDWVYGASLSAPARIWAYTVELRDTGAAGFVLPPDQIQPTAEENWRGIKVLSQYILSQAGGSTCYANCDASTTAPVLNAGDFSCFLTRFRSDLSLPAAQQVASYANCDQSTTPPSLNAGDFSCFLTRFRAGCP
jgi:carboxypeptidase A4